MRCPFTNKTSLSVLSCNLPVPLWRMPVPSQKKRGWAMSKWRRTGLEKRRPASLWNFLSLFSYWCPIFFHVAVVQDGAWDLRQGLCVSRICIKYESCIYIIYIYIIFSCNHTFVCEYIMTFFPSLFPAFWWFLCVGLIKWSCRSCGKVLTWLLDLHSIYIV